MCICDFYGVTLAGKCQQTTELILDLLQEVMKDARAKYPGNPRKLQLRAGAQFSASLSR